MSKTEVHIAVCADKNIEPGLHVTLYSVLEKLNSEFSVFLYLFLKGYKDDDIKLIQSTLKAFNKRYTLRVINIDKLDLGKGRDLHLSKMAYCKLYVPEIIDAEKVLCLDSDLLVLTDLGELFFHDLQRKAVGLVTHSLVSFALPKERHFLNTLGIPDSDLYFNTGVILFDCTLWKEGNYTEKCKQFMRKYNRNLCTGDQTVINAVLRRDITTLPGKYNMPSYPPHPIPKIDNLDLVCHFVGSPKPWDLFGRYIHVGYPAFKIYFDKTSLAHVRNYRRITLGKIKRTIALIRSYYRAIKEKKAKVTV